MNEVRPLWARALERSIECTLAVTGVIVAAPLMIALAVHSAYSLRAWPFFAQTRVGLGQEPFRLYKIRTLPTATPSDADKYQLAHHPMGRLARHIRHLHLDELPQLVLVLTGRMALVGPRPEMQQLHDSLNGHLAAARTSVRPGCSGLWQISEAAAGLIGEAPEYDLFYVANRTLRLDLWILAKTPQVLLFGKTVTLDDVPRWALPQGRRSALPVPRPHDQVAVESVRAS